MGVLTGLCEWHDVACELIAGVDSDLEFWVLDDHLVVCQCVGTLVIFDMFHGRIQVDSNGRYVEGFEANALLLHDEIYYAITQDW